MNRSRWTAAAMAAGALTAVSVAAPVGARSLWAPNAPTPMAEGGRPTRLDIVGLTDNGKLVSFREDRPGRIKDVGWIKGLDQDDSLVGIDYRVPFTDAAGVSNNVPAGGTLYGLGRSGAIYSIDARKAVATRTAKMDMALEGVEFGVDFNPTVDRLRVVSDTGQNLRINVDTGATLRDTALNSDAGNPTLGVTAAAYTNNDTDPATATTLYDIDTAANRLVIQNPPNAGTLAPVGALTVDVDARAGFDLYSATVTSGAVQTTVDVRGFAVLSVMGKSSLYRITPFSGRAIVVGTFDRNVVDLAIPLSR